MQAESNKLLLKRIADLENILKDARAEQRYLRQIIALHGTREAKRLASVQRPAS